MIAVLVLVAIPPLVLLGWMSLNVTTQSLRANVLKEETGRAAGLGAEVTQFLNGVKSDIEFLSKAPALGDYLAASDTPAAAVEGAAPEGSPKDAARMKLEKQFFAFSESKQIYRQIRFIATNGKEIARVDFDGNKRWIVAQAKLQNKKGRYYFDDAVKLNKDQIFVSPLDLNMEGGKIQTPHVPVIRYATPVFHNDAVQGIVIVNVLADKMLAKLTSHEGRSTYLVAADGQYFMHPEDAKRWGTQLKSGESLMKDFAGESSVLMASDTGAIEGTTMLFAHAAVPSPSKAGTNWSVVTTRQVAEVMAPVASFRTTFGGAVGGAFVVVVIAAFALAGRITGPLQKLNEAANRLSTGDLEHKIAADTEDEIHELGESLERLRVSMQVSLASMEQMMDAGGDDDI